MDVRRFSEGDMDSSASRSSGNERENAILNSKAESCCGQFRNGSNPWMARYLYALMFLVCNLLAWVSRDYGYGALKEMERLEGCHGAQDCLGTEGVLRVSLGCFLIMFLSTVCTSKLQEPRNAWHSGWWSVKTVLLITLIIVPFLVPSAFIRIYGEVAHFGAGVFLLVQLVSIISFIMWLDDCCRSDKYREKCYIQKILLAATAYVVCIGGIILMYIWYAPDTSCLLNIFFITWTLVLLQLMTSVSLHPKVNAGFLIPGLMGLYVVFICWCAIRSEPAGESCNRKAEASHSTDWLTIISFIVAMLAIVIATFSTGIDSQCFQFVKTQERAASDVPYGYGFFHFVFATGAMYFGMLFIGWNSHYPMKKWTIDVGWTSTWVKIVNEWVAVCVFIWMLVAPVVWKCRQAGGAT
ncbi:hypothetical protein EUGRSUZ_C01067 [Eucalyptus grandis]|uniref:Uncharacterized protein n=2 Tax=Eucalyptus grandis TaxID=71139 RepID=A0ACC3LC67_EUCGR|nr:hypothetical protein EUGRSUZ_C01067 [Eucalyptus grandis]